MPIYEYRCQQCGAVSEHLVGMGGEEEVACLQCGSSDVARILSVATVAARQANSRPGQTCCGRSERCERPPCASGGGCRRDG